MSDITLEEEIRRIDREQKRLQAEHEKLLQGKRRIERLFLKYSCGFVALVASLCFADSEMYELLSAPVLWGVPYLMLVSAPLVLYKFGLYDMLPGVVSFNRLIADTLALLDILEEAKQHILEKIRQEKDKAVRPVESSNPQGKGTNPLKRGVEEKGQEGQLQSSSRGVFATTAATGNIGACSVEKGGALARSPYSLFCTVTGERAANSAEKPAEAASVSLRNT